MNYLPLFQEDDSPPNLIAHHVVFKAIRHSPILETGVHSSFHVGGGCDSSLCWPSARSSLSGIGDGGECCLSALLSATPDVRRRDAVADVPTGRGGNGERSPFPRWGGSGDG